MFSQFFCNYESTPVQVGFHLVAKIIRELKSHMIPYKFKCANWLKLKTFRLESKLPPMRALEFMRDHVTFKLPYDFSYQMKTQRSPKLSIGVFLAIIIHYWP